jgi:sulfur carrier protein ThiS
MVEIHLGGHLAFYAPQKKSRLSMQIDQTTRLDAILRKLGLPQGEVALAAVNGEMVDPASAMIEPGDKIELVSPMGGG